LDGGVVHVTGQTCRTRDRRRGDRDAGVLRRHRARRAGRIVDHASCATQDVATRLPAGVLDVETGSNHRPGLHGNQADPRPLALRQLVDATQALDRFTVGHGLDSETTMAH
jgi:hypothetical protein